MGLWCEFVKLFQQLKQIYGTATLAVYSISLNIDIKTLKKETKRWPLSPGSSATFTPISIRTKKAIT